MVVGVLLALTVTSRRGRILGLVAYGVFAGFGTAAVLQTWLGVLAGDYLRNAGAIGLFALAAAATVTGLGALLGRAGVGLGALLVFLISNPLSAVSAAPELLPRPWGEVGQWLPVAAGATLIRSAAFFDGAGGTHALWVLVGYAVVGLLLALVGRAGLAGRTARSTTGDPATPADLTAVSSTR